MSDPGRWPAMAALQLALSGRRSVLCAGTEMLVCLDALPLFDKPVGYVAQNNNL